jgi:tetratricopeptide (TPR) repeat protein
MLRRAHLYRADCAFHLGFLEQAIELYDRAARLYSAHAASMYALVQIVNCYNQLNDEERAGAAHRRALVRLKQLPDSAFDSPESLMNRAAWERWLDNSPVGTTLSSAAKTG